jgi:putative salt-induced outer membrane protein YdiY
MNRFKQIICLAALVTLTTTAAFGQSAPTAPLDTGWLTTAAFGLSLAKGNSDNFLVTGNLLSSRKWNQNELDLGLNGTYGQTDGTVNQGNIHGFGQYNRLVSERVYIFMRLDALNDGVAEINYRITLSPGAGYYFIKNTNTFLRAEAGPGFVFEKMAGNTDNYVSLRLAERYEHRFNDGFKLWQSLEYLPALEDFNNYIGNFEIGIEAALTKKMSLRVYLQDSYDSVPAPGLKRNDVKLVAALAYKF